MWGEIAETQVDNEPQTAQTLDLSPIIEQSRQKDCLSMYQISSGVNEIREINLPPMDPRMLYAAALHNYISTMTNVIEDAELAVEYNLVMPAEMPALEVPDPPLVTTNIVTRKPIHFLDKEYSSFSMGFGKNPPMLSESTRRQIETQCVATMLAHIGFMNANESVLDILTDVFGIFMKKICKELRCANDSLLTGESSGFSDIVEQVLMRNGLGGVRGICEYYERKIKKYEEVLKERCQGVVSRYDLLVAPGNMQIECKTERVDDLEDNEIPEVHFTSEEGYLQPFLESGFQMLNSLEEGQL